MGLNLPIQRLFLFYTNIMEQIKYTDEFIRKELMHYMGYDEQQAAQLVDFYKRNDKLDDLVSVTEEKRKACSRL